MPSHEVYYDLSVCYELSRLVNNCANYAISAISANCD